MLMNTHTKLHVIWAKRLKFVKILSSLELNVGSSDRGRNQLGLGLGLGLDPSVISRLFCVGRSPELVISRPFGALPSGCWWSTDFAGDLPTFAGEFLSSLVIYRLLLVISRQLVTSRRFGDLPIFSWWCPDLWWFPDFFCLCLPYWC